MFCSFRCREKQRKEASRLQAVNRKLTAMNKLLMEENDRLQKQVSQLVYENGYFRQHTQNVRKYEFLFIFSSNVRIISAKTTDIIIQDCIFLLEKKKWHYLILQSVNYQKNTEYIFLLPLLLSLFYWIVGKLRLVFFTFGWFGR